MTSGTWASILLAVCVVSKSVTTHTPGHTGGLMGDQDAQLTPNRDRYPEPQPLDEEGEPGPPAPYSLL